MQGVDRKQCTVLFTYNFTHTWCFPRVPRIFMARVIPLPRVDHAVALRGCLYHGMATTRGNSTTHQHAWLNTYKATRMDFYS